MEDGMSTETCPPTRHVSDEQLILRVRSGDREAFDLLYERYVGRVYRFIETRLSNRADVEETTQECHQRPSRRSRVPLRSAVRGLVLFRAPHYRVTLQESDPIVPLEADEHG